jgi:Flp pilus assembly protein TadG
MIGRLRDRATFGRAGARGQGLVEFALVLTPLFLVLLGIIQVGLVINGYVTIANASREGARTASVYLYDQTLTPPQNDAARNETARQSILASMGLLTTSAPEFGATSTWTGSGNTYTDGDLVVTYTVPAGVTASDARSGEQMSISLTYHLDLIIPMISGILPHDVNGRLPLGAQVTMVVN